MSDVTIAAEPFFDRLNSIYTAWKADKRTNEAFNGADSIIVLTGKAEQDASIYQKNNTLHFWLLGYEFPATLIVFTLATVYFVTTEKKAKHLKDLTGGKIPVEILTVETKKPETRTEAFKKCLDVIKAAGKKVGTISKYDATGPFVDEWKRMFSETSKELEEVDISAALSMAFAIKDENELRSVRSAALASSSLLQEYWVEEMSDVLDAEKQVSHTKLADGISRKLDDAKFFKKIAKLPADFDIGQLDWAYGPFVQSGGEYDIRLTTQPAVNNNNMHDGCIIAGLGVRYKTYCAAVARTYLVDPSKSQTTHYKLLLSAHEAAIDAARDGVPAKDVYNKALGLIKSKKPDLEKNFGKNIGAAVGIELKDNNYILNSKNTKVLRDGMTLTICTSLSDLVNDKPQGKKGTNYSLLLVDTIRVSPREPAVFTRTAKTDLDGVEFYFKEEEEEVKPKKKEEKKPGRSAVATSNIKSSRLRNANRQDGNQKEEEEARRKSHQKELAQKKQRDGLEKYAEATGDNDGGDEKKFKKFESYRREEQLPSKIKDLVVYVDTKASTVILPIMGRPVPFHINTIKNVSKSDEGEYTQLRFNFLSPGQGVGRKDDQPFEDPSAHFIRSLTVRSKDQDRLGDVATQITELRKAAVRREQEKKEMEDVVEQEKLIEIRNRRPIKLGEVYIRPAQDGKRVTGELEIHQNGLRYHTPNRSDNVDVVFSNVKHLFFQPCVGELIVIIHVHLKNPILIGKRKTKDVQFFREATDIAFDDTGNRKRKHRYGDDEEFQQEQDERRRRADLDKTFKSFAEKISDAGREQNISVDIPFRDLSFNGVPHRSNVIMAPATDALVQLTEPPFSVLTLDEIEVAHLERIQVCRLYLVHLNDTNTI